MLRFAWNKQTIRNNTIFAISKKIEHFSLTKKNPKRVSINQNDIFKESSEEELDKLENIKFWRKARDRKKKKKPIIRLWGAV